MNDLTKDLLEALRDIAATNASKHGTGAMMAARCSEIARAAIARAEAALDTLKPIHTNGNREMTMKDRNFTAGKDGFISDNNFDFDAGLKVSGDFVGDEKQRYAEMIAAALNKVSEAALAEPQPDADGWINPNDKTRKQYLPHIGEKVLFCHAGVTYYGKHTGGAFQSFNPPRMFETWICLWMYPPKAREAQS